MNSIQPHRSNAAPADRAPASRSRGRRRLALVFLALLAPVVVGAGLAPTLQSSHPVVVVKGGAVRSSGSGTLLTGCDTTHVLFGPKTYVRANGTPVTVLDSFPLAGANEPFHLVLVNGLPDGSHRATGGTVRVNGTLVITSGDLGTSVDSLSRSISLQNTNTIEVRITGTPAGQFTLRVTGSLTVLPTIALVAPPDSLLTGADSVTVHGAATGGASLAVTVNGLDAPRDANDSFTVQVPLPDEGWNTITAIADDGCQSASAVRHVQRDTQAPALAVSAPTDGATTTADSITVTGTASDASPFTLTVNGAATPVDGSGAFSRNVALALGSNTITVVATDVLGHSTTVTRGVTRNPTGPQLPPDPSLVAPALDPTGVTTFVDQTAFLYTGAGPIQTGVAPGTITPVRASVMRGRVLMRDGSPLPGATITIVGHPEFGQTLSRADGMYDMAVNGGGLMTVNAAKTGFLPGQRTIDVRRRDYAVVDSLALVGIDPAVTTVDFASPIEVAQGSSVTDADGTRRATMMFEQGTAATMTLPNGSTQPLSSIHVRATEYTVGPNGPTAMPAALPPTSAYTYCVELSADEAIAAGATSVQFSKAVPLYVENFLGLAVGLHVPLGFYDRQTSAWESSPDGRVIKVVGVTSGVADVDATGDGVAESTASLDSLGLDATERTQLATSYAVGQSLMRVETNHFSTADLNFYETNGNAGNGVGATPQDQPTNCPETQSGSSVIECENQVLGEDVSLAGTPFALHYRSYRVPGYTAARRIKIPLVGTTVPSSLGQVKLVIDIAGRTFSSQFSPSANLSTVFEWDGRDAYGRTLLGRTTAKIRIQNVYHGFYLAGPPVLASFGIPCAGAGCLAPLNVSGRTDFPVTRTEYVGVGTPSMESAGLGGWSLDPHHVYDPVGNGTTFYGDGSRRVGGRINPIIVSLGISTSTFRYGSDGSLFVLRSEGFAQDKKLRRILPDGTSTVIFSSNFGYGGDGGPASAAGFNEPNDFDVAADGTIYVADTDNGRVRRIGLDGIVTTVAGGNGFSCSGPTSGLGTSLAFNGVYHLRCAPDGSVYFTSNCAYLYRLTPDGMVAAVAGTGVSGTTGDGGPATLARIDSPSNLAVAPDGAVYLGVNSKVRRVGTNGIITTVAGSGASSFIGDGVQAVSQGMFNLSGLEVTADGTLLISVAAYHRLLQVSPEGLCRTLAGNGIDIVSGDGGPATAAGLFSPGAIDVDPEGRVVVNTGGGLRRIQSPMPGFSVTQYTVASERGNEVHVFDAMGRHLRTLDALTGAKRYEFGYDTAHHLSTITDIDGRITRVLRDASGVPTAIVNPFGTSTSLGVDGNGYLNLVRDPTASEWHFSYGQEGLLTQEEHPNGAPVSFSYDGLGRLTNDADADGTFQHLSLIEGATSYSVTRTTAEGRTTNNLVETLASGTVRQTQQDAAGLATIKSTNLSGVTTTTRPDGSTSTTTWSPDPRFGMSAPFLSATSIRTPSGNTATFGVQRIYTPGSNSVALAAQEDRTTVNGRTFLSRFESGPRRITEATAAGRITITRIDSAGRPLAVRVAGLDSLVYSYDSQGRLISSQIGGRQWLVGYDPKNRIASVTDPASNARHFEYDDADRLIRQVLADGRDLRYRYDSNGNILSVTSPAGRVHGFGNSDFDLATSYTPPESSEADAIHFIYNLDQQLTRIDRPNGEHLDLGYDAAGRMTSLSTGHGPITLAYSGTTGNLQTLTSPDGVSTSYQYDGMLQTRETWSGVVNGNVFLTYDSDFRPVTQQLNGTQTINFGYDADGLLTSAGGLTINRRSDNGLTSSTSIGVAATQLSYNSAGDWDQMLASVSGSPAYSAHYAYDSLGRVTTLDQTILGTHRVQSYGYDARGQLVDVFENSLLSAHFDYDPDGNRTAFTGAAPTDTATATYDGEGRLVRYGAAQFAYTGNGDLMQRVVGVDTTRYSYDLLGNLTTVLLPDGDRIDYLVDGRGRRVVRKLNGAVTSSWIYQDAMNPVAELDSTGAVVARFVYGTMSATPDYVIRGTTTYRIVADRNGSPLLAIDVASGAVAARREYDVWGNVTLDTQPSLFLHGFAGGLYDAMTGLVRFGARDYDPTVGRWTCKEGLQAPDLVVSTYQYASNEPTTLVDVTGLAPNRPQPSPYSSSQTISVMSLFRISACTGEQVNASIKGFWEHRLVEKYWYFFQMVQKRKTLDIKNNKYGKQLPDGGEAAGNVNYGVLGAALGIPDEILRLAAGIADELENLSHLKLLQFLKQLQHYPFDDLDDTQNINYGIQLYREYLAHCDCTKRR